MNLKKTIFTGFAPNLVLEDVVNSMKFLLLPWYWGRRKRGDSVAKVEEWLRDYFGIKYAITFDSGRSSLYYGLKAMDIKEGDEVILQAYTCVVVVNAIKQTGATPIYADIDDNFNMDPVDLEKKITKNTKVILIQHTFGIPADIDELLNIAKTYHIRVIEDCAHSLGATYRGVKLGTFSDLAILSFGSDKVVSSNRGGAVITNDDLLAKKINEFKERLSYVSHWKIIQYLFYFPTFYKGKVLYSLGIGKAILYLAKTLHITNRVISKEEKQGKQSIFYPALFPNCLAFILLGQLKRLILVNSHRRMIARLYSKKIKNSNVRLPNMVGGGIFLRYNILTDKPDVLRAMCKEENIILGDWYNTVVAPKDIAIEKTGYKPASCPRAEKFASQSVNLPTNIGVQSGEVDRVVRIVNSL